MCWQICFLWECLCKWGAEGAGGGHVQLYMNVMLYVYTEMPSRICYVYLVFV